MVQKFYPCSNCLDLFTSRELILVETKSMDQTQKHWIVCEECLAELEESGLLVGEEMEPVEV